jgi:hypothetical protein
MSVGGLNVEAVVVCWGGFMSEPSILPIRRQAAEALRRARKLPIGHARDDLRQVALGLLWLEKRGYVAIPDDLVRESEWRKRQRK